MYVLKFKFFFTIFEVETLMNHSVAHYGSPINQFVSELTFDDKTLELPLGYPNFGNLTHIWVKKLSNGTTNRLPKFRSFNLYFGKIFAKTSTGSICTDANRF